MAADAYAVSYITHTMRGAPVLNGNTPGSLIAALDALLVTGWGAAAPDSITVASGVAIAHFASATAWEVGAVLQIDGATPAAINGKGRVLTSSGNTLTFSTSAPDGSYTGAGIKYAPAGWEKPFSATNKAVYRSQDPLDSRHYLRVDDSHAQWARVRGYEAMSDVDTGTGPFPTDTHISGGWYWYRSNRNSATAIPYLLAADRCLVLAAISIGVGAGAGGIACSLRGFGSPLALNPAGDAYASILCGQGSGSDSWYGAGLAGMRQPSASADGCVSPRAAPGTGTSTWARPFALTGSETAISGACPTLGAAPSAIDGQIKTSRVALRDQVPDAPPRSLVPGVLYIPQTGAAGVLGAAYARTDGGSQWPGRQFAVLPHDAASPTTPTGASLLDLTGPWR